MILYGSLKLILWIAVLPMVIGGLFLPFFRDRVEHGTAGVAERVAEILFCWICGQMILWTLLQIVAVPVILREGSFVLVKSLMLGTVSALAVGAILNGLLGRKALPAAGNKGMESKTAGIGDRGSLVLWILVILLLGGMLLMSILGTYTDGDDAYYMAVANDVVIGDSMYFKSPYLGVETEFDARHALAPFPLWISLLARVSGLKTALIAHSVVSPVLILLGCGVFFLMGRVLCRENLKSWPVFMLFAEFLLLFGDVSIYTPENFLLARSRQGKAALATLVIPFILFLLYLYLEKFQESHRTDPFLEILLLSSAFCSCLCSTQGGMLCGALLGVSAVIFSVMYRSAKPLLHLWPCAIPCAIYLLLYVRVG